MLLSLVWVAATVGVTYVANAAVELVDLQVFPQGARIEVLARAQPMPTTPLPMRATTVVSPTTTVVSPTTTVVSPTTTVVSPIPMVLLEQGPGEYRMGADYRERLVTGGDAPFKMSVVSGDLPPGLEIDDAGYLWGSLESSGRFEAQLEVIDSAGQMKSGLITIFVKEFRVITARGGSVTVAIAGNSVEFFSALQGVNFESAQIQRSGPIVVEVSFIPKTGDETSWVRCEVVDEVVCTHG